MKKLFLIFLGILVPLSITFALEIDWPPSPMGTNLTTTSTLTELSRYLYEWGIALGGLAAFIALLVAGFLYLTSVGDPQKLADARSRIFWALAGLVLLLAAWLILDTINPDLTRPYLEELLPGCDASSTIDTAVTPCPGAQTCCKPDFICIGDKNPGDGTKEGVCFSWFDTTAGFYGGEVPSCVYARFWKTKNFAGAPVGMAFLDGPGAFTLIPADPFRSVKSFYDDGGECATNTLQAVCEAVVDSAGNRLCDWNLDATTAWGTNCFKDCGQTACGCYLKPYDTAVPGFLPPPLPPIPFITCLNKIGNYLYIPAYSKDLTVYKEEGLLGLSDGEISCALLRRLEF